MRYCFIRISTSNTITFRLRTLIHVHTLTLLVRSCHVSLYLVCNWLSPKSNRSGKPQKPEIRQAQRCMSDTFNPDTSLNVFDDRFACDFPYSSRNQHALVLHAPSIRGIPEVLVNQHDKWAVFLERRWRQHKQKTWSKEDFQISWQTVPALYKGNNKR